MHTGILRAAFTVMALVITLPAAAQSIDVRQPWIRGTVPGQTATGAFMEITSRLPARLVAVASPAAGAVEIHRMKMDGNVMRMSAVDGIDLPVNKVVRLAPGGYHVMMMDLKRPLKAGERVPLQLTIELADRRRETIALEVEVRDMTGEARHGH